MRKCNNIKRAMGVFLTVFYIILLSCPLNSFAAGKFEYGITADKSEAKGGDTITVELMAENNPGVAFLVFEVDYDEEVFSVESKSVGNILPDNNGRPLSDDQAGDVIFSLGTDTASDNTTDTGELAKVVFKVKDQAKEQDTTIEVKGRDAFNSDIVEVSVKNASLTVHIDNSSSSKADESDENKEDPATESDSAPSADTNNSSKSSSNSESIQDEDNNNSSDSRQDSEGENSKTPDDAFGSDNENNSGTNEQNNQTENSDINDSASDVASGKDIDPVSAFDSISDDDVIIEESYTTETYSNDADKNDETQYSNGGIWWLIGGCVVAAAAIAGYAIMIKRK